MQRELQTRANDKPHGMLPGMLPDLRTLVLTGVPCHDKSGEALSFLIDFIRACADEAEIAGRQAGIENKRIRIPEDSQMHVSKVNGVERFSLARIVLEMGPLTSTSGVQSIESPRTPLTPRTSFRTRSSTEDPDSEALWSAQENDFSFFDDDEECGLPSKETLHLPLATLSEKVAMPADDLSGPLPTLEKPPTMEFNTDVVQSLADFRKNRKAAYEEALRSGVRHVDGYWPGEIKVVRWDAQTKNRADFYGNVYEQGIYH